MSNDEQELKIIQLDGNLFEDINNVYELLHQQLEATTQLVYNLDSLWTWICEIEKSIKIIWTNFQYSYEYQYCFAIKLLKLFFDAKTNFNWEIILIC